MYRWLTLLLLCIQIPIFSHAQSLETVEAIRQLRDGYLVVRFPRHKNKIDTLNAMAARSKDPNSKKRLEALINDTEAQRDSIVDQYIRAFKEYYTFSKVAYFFDYEARNPEKVSYTRLDGKQLSWDELTTSPIYFLHFERTEGSKIDALVIHDRLGKVVPKPFPNNFARGGFSLLFLSFAEKSAAEWRVKSMNKKLFKFWSAVN